jgi:DNA polymerase III alpha subunit
MDSVEAHSPNTKLKDRVLWYDGDSTVDEDTVVRYLTLGLPVDGVFVNNITDDIAQYNSLVSPEQQIRIKTECNLPKVEWVLPDEFKTLDVRAYVLDKLTYECLNVADTLNRERVNRTLRELKTYENLDLFDFLRALIYIINTLQAHNVVWGVGRGSSVSSYVLYLIGVHDVDSVLYSLDITDFLHAK